MRPNAQLRKMVLIDTHTHLYTPDFDADREAVLERAQASGVERFYLPAIDSAHTERMLRLVDRWPDACFPMIGLHPVHVAPNTLEDELQHVSHWLDKRPFKAIGEIGIDLHWDPSTQALQREAFRNQIRWAKQRALPIVIHCRKAFDAVFEVLDGEADQRLFGIFHCFGGNRAQAERAIGYNLKLGIGGVVTFKNAGLDKTLQSLPLEHLVLETDAPYLAPVPHRGQRNEPAYLQTVVQKLSTLYGLPEAEIARITTASALEVFERERVC